MMRLPTVQGVIHRRILVNFRVDPEVIQRHLPMRFRPKLYEGSAIAGICLIRLEHIRPRMLPEIVGLNSENAAHRIAVLWDDEQRGTQEGVYIFRRDTDSEINHLLGGRVFPGEHHKATFQVEESKTEITLAMESQDKTVKVDIKGKIAENLPASSIFPSLAAASAFFQPGALGYSVTGDPHRLDGVRLATKEWRVEPLEMEKVSSHFFSDTEKFPNGSAAFDHTLIMRNIAHEWRRAADLYV